MFWIMFVASNGHDGNELRTLNIVKFVFAQFLSEN